MTEIAIPTPRRSALARRGAAIAIGMLAMALLLIASQGRAAAAQTVVSIEFDDGTSNQYGVRDVLTAHGMDGTFYVYSALVGDEDHMSWAQLHALADDGNEIGGHTLDHPHLTQLTAEQQHQQICQDRANLQAQGFTVRNFAYPFGDFDATTQSIVGDCGYDTGRGVSGTASCGRPSSSPWAGSRSGAYSGSGRSANASAAPTLSAAPRRSRCRTRRVPVAGSTIPPTEPASRAPPS